MISLKKMGNEPGKDCYTKVVTEGDPYNPLTFVANLDILIPTEHDLWNVSGIC